MSNPYESNRLLAEYLLFHYGRSEEILPYAFGPSSALDFPARVVSECIDVAALPPHAQALDVGCAVGRSSFELARHCESVVGIDFSNAFVRAANTVKDGGRLPYERTEEGRLMTSLVACAPEGIDRTRLHFEAGDACELRADLGQLDVVLAANLVDRLPAPEKFLARLPALVKPGGQLIIASPFTWLEEYTPPDKWLGGYERAGQRVVGFETLRTILETDFEFCGSKELPMLIREHARKFQWSISLAGTWRRR